MTITLDQRAYFSGLSGRQAGSRRPKGWSPGVCDGTGPVSHILQLLLFPLILSGVYTCMSIPAAVVESDEILGPAVHCVASVFGSTTGSSIAHLLWHYYFNCRPIFISIAVVVANFCLVVTLTFKPIVTVTVRSVLFAHPADAYGLVAGRTGPTLHGEELEKWSG